MWGNILFHFKYTVNVSYLDDLVFPTDPEVSEAVTVQDVGGVDIHHILYSNGNSVTDAGSESRTAIFLDSYLCNMYFTYTLLIHILTIATV